MESKVIRLNDYEILLLRLSLCKSLENDNNMLIRFKKCTESNYDEKIYELTKKIKVKENILNKLEF